MEYAVPREAGLAGAARGPRAGRRGPTGGSASRSRSGPRPADDVPLSTAYERDSSTSPFHINAQTDHRGYFRAVEEILRAYDGRPHWGKLHTRTAADLAPAYPRWQDFQAMRDRLDPDRVFTNAYLTGSSA